MMRLTSLFCVKSKIKKTDVELSTCRILYRVNDAISWDSLKTLRSVKYQGADGENTNNAISAMQCISIPLWQSSDAHFRISWQIVQIIDYELGEKCTIFK